MRNLRKALITVIAAGAVLAAPAAAQASSAARTSAPAVQHVSVARNCQLSIPVIYKKNGNHDFHWTTKDTCGRTVRTQLQRSSYRGWVGYSGWSAPRSGVIIKWEIGCRYGAGTYNYRAAAEALTASGTWSSPAYSGVLYADHCGASAP